MLATVGDPMPIKPQRPHPDAGRDFVCFWHGWVVLNWDGVCQRCADDLAEMRIKKLSGVTTTGDEE